MSANSAFSAGIRTLTIEHAKSDRMPAFLAKDDWATWLAENGASPDDAKACLKTVEGIKWTMSKAGALLIASRQATIATPSRAGSCP